VSGHHWPVVLAIVGAVACGPTLAQDLTQGKSPAQLFAGDCAACHKSPQGLARGGDVRSTASFLREHYTTKPEMAEALAAYVVGAGGSARGAVPDRNDSSNRPQGRASASNSATGTEGARPLASIPFFGGDDSNPPDAGDSAKPSPKPRATPVSAPSKPADAELPKPSKPRSAAAVDEREGPKARANNANVDARRGGDDDTAADASKPKPRAGRADDSKRQGDALASVPTGKLNSYARAGVSEKDKVGEGNDVAKLRAYATSGDPAPAQVPAPATGLKTSTAALPAEPSVAPEPASDATKISAPGGLRSDDAAKSEPRSESEDAPKPAAEEPPKPAKPRRAATNDGADAKPPRRAESNSPPPMSPMSFFGRILSGGARTRDSNPGN
jgi:hypothetical protein